MESEATILAYKNKHNRAQLDFAPQWVHTAEFRGTATICGRAWSRFWRASTLVLHLNVPQQRGGLLHASVCKITWMLDGAGCAGDPGDMASSQFLRARRLQQELNRLSTSPTLRAPASKRENRTRTPLKRRSYPCQPARCRRMVAGASLQAESRQSKQLSKGQRQKKAQPKVFDLRYCFFVVMGGHRGLASRIVRESNLLAGKCCAASRRVGPFCPHPSTQHR